MDKGKSKFIRDQDDLTFMSSKDMVVGEHTAKGGKANGGKDKGWDKGKVKGRQLIDYTEDGKGKCQDKGRGKFNSNLDDIISGFAEGGKANSGKDKGKAKGQGRSYQLTDDVEYHGPGSKSSWCPMSLSCGRYGLSWQCFRLATSACSHCFSIFVPVRIHRKRRLPEDKPLGTLL